jgi:hypothetical protein
MVVVWSASIQTPPRSDDEEPLNQANRINTTHNPPAEPHTRTIQYYTYTHTYQGWLLPRHGRIGRGRKHQGG